MPATPPTLIEAEALMMVAATVAVLCASTITSCALSSELERTKALVFVRMTLVASAPAPLTPAPTPPAKLAATDAAAVRAVIVAASVALTLMSPTVLCRSSALAIEASTSLEISL